jgi:Zn finger protein HypA/HybF involved in hydrogenase expression
VIADRRTLFERALRKAKCPKCEAKTYEMDMPNVICSKCSTKYTLTTRVDFPAILRWKLIDQNNEEKMIIKEKEVIVKIRCSHCHNLRDETMNNCPHCGAHV